MKLIDHTTLGLIPWREGSIAGRLVALRNNNGIERLQVRKLQIVKATGGVGCDPLKMGSGVFVTPMWAEIPPGSGKLQLVKDRDEDWKASRSDVIGLVSDELLADVSTDPDSTEPGDIDDLCVLAAGAGRWAKGNTVAEALRGIGKRTTGKDIAVWVVHRETYINDMGFVCTSNHFVKEGRPSAQVVHGDKGVTRTLAEAEEHAAALIRAARG